MSVTNIRPELPFEGTPTPKRRTLEDRVRAALGKDVEVVKWTLLAFQHVHDHTVGSKGQRESSDKNRAEAILAFIEFTGRPIWEWNSRDVDAYFKHLYDKGLALSTRRGHQTHIRMFCAYVIADPTLRNGIYKAFGKNVVQVITPLNSIIHKNAKETTGNRVALTYEEVDQLFDNLDDAIDIAIEGHCRSAHTLLRDKTIVAMMYATGLREDSIKRLSLHSFGQNPHRPEFGNFGVVTVLGKNNKLNTVTLLDPNISRMLELYLEQVRSVFFRVGRSTVDKFGDAFFISERGKRLGAKTIYRAAVRAGQIAGLAKPCFPHILRHTYCTHSRPLQGAENTQKQMNHAFGATTDGYYHLDVERTSTQMNDAIQHTIDIANKRNNGQA